MNVELKIDGTTGVYYIQVEGCTFYGKAGEERETFVERVTELVREDLRLVINVN